MKKGKWYKLDNVGKFFAFTNKSKVPAVFRYSVTIEDGIDPIILQTALDNTLKIFPNFQVHLKRGFFWYYLETTNKKVKVEKEHLPICSKLYKDSDDVLFRVNYFKDRINFEVSHILSDGRGSLKFFKALIYQYIIYNYSVQGIEIEDNSSEAEKREDSFDKYYTKSKSKLPKNKNIYNYKEKLSKNITYMEYHLPTDRILSLAHNYNASLTALLISIMIYSYMEEMKEIELSQIIKIDVPVDLRQFLKSQTSRNFFGLTHVSYKFSNKNEPFENVIKSVNEQLKTSATIENLKIRVNQLISFEKNILARFVPLFLKNIILNIADKISTVGCTSCLSNIGAIKVDKKVEPYIKNFNVLNATGTLRMTICSFKNDLSIGICSKYENNQIIKNFCSFFADKYITGILNINKENDYE